MQHQPLLERFNILPVFDPLLLAPGLAALAGGDVVALAVARQLTMTRDACLNWRWDWRQD
ncbi:MAG: hypothetical protein FJY39_04710 [Betaproteobacteria bacterium]|nr:hypothetical protein [Betaproteobacteria bacterium]